MKRGFLIFFILLSYSICNAQLRIDSSVDTLESDVKSAIRFYKSYLRGFRDTSMPDFRSFWMEEDCNNYKYPDQMIYGISSDYPTYRMGKATVIYIKPHKDYIHIKTHFGWSDTLGTVSTLAITNHYLKPWSDGRYRFINPIKMSSHTWKSTTVRNVTFHYPAYHKFDKKKADTLIQRIVNLEKSWGLPQQKIRYYFADTKEEIQHLRGFDYTMDMGNREKPSGISDSKDNVVYCSGWGENYFHEVVHIYLNRHYQESPLKEGMAVFYGGSLGHSLGWHLHRLNNYLQDHPEIDLSDPDAMDYMDNYTNPRSAVLGLICQMAYDANGVAGLKEIMEYESINNIMRQIFQVPPKKINSYLRNIIATEYGITAKKSFL